MATAYSSKTVLYPLPFWTRCASLRDLLGRIECLISLINSADFRPNGAWKFAKRLTVITSKRKKQIRVFFWGGGQFNDYFNPHHAFSKYFFDSNNSRFYFAIAHEDTPADIPEKGDCVTCSVMLVAVLIQWYPGGRLVIGKLLL